MGENPPMGTGYYAGDWGSEVDVEAMARVPEWVTFIREYINTNLTEKVLSMKMSDSDTMKNTFGGFDSAVTVGNKHNMFVDTVYKAYKAIYDSLEDFGEGTTEILERYKTTEARNTANVQDILSLLGDGSDSSTTGQPGSNVGSGERYA